MRKAFVFDFDDTLATTTARIRVMDGASGLVTHVQPRDFSSFQLNRGEFFDFTEFRDDRCVHSYSKRR